MKKLLCACFVLTICSINIAAVRELTPVEMYNVVYGVVANNYLDKTYNNQDLRIWSYEQRYKGMLKDQEDADLAIRTMLLSLNDRYTRYLDAEGYKDEMDSISAKLQGIGVHIGMNEDKKVIVISPIQGSPAYEAGLLPKDEFTEIEGKSTKGMSVEDVASKIKGQPDTSVRIKIMRDGEEKSFTIKRAEIHVESIPDQHYRKINDDICYLHLTSFISQDASTELSQRLKSLGQCPSLILDLRNNPGGLLINAIEMGSVFLPQGSDIVSTVDRDGYIQTQKTLKVSETYTAPMVILTNGGSASASETLCDVLRGSSLCQLLIVPLFCEPQSVCVLTL